MSQTWSEQTLSSLPEAHGFRLRGAEMTRLETFIDAAFAFGHLTDCQHGYFRSLEVINVDRAFQPIVYKSDLFACDLEDSIGLDGNRVRPVPDTHGSGWLCLRG